MKTYHNYPAQRKMMRLVLPRLVPAKRLRSLGGIDVFALSPAKKELMPDNPKRADGRCDVAAYRRELAAAYHTLSAEAQAKFEEEAAICNAEAEEQELEEAGSLGELSCAAYVCICTRRAQAIDNGFQVGLLGLPTH